MDSKARVKVPEIHVSSEKADSMETDLPTTEAVVDSEDLAKVQLELEDASAPPEKKKKVDGFLSWAMIVVAVGLLISISAQEFTVEQYYDSFTLFASLTEKSELNKIMAWITDWAIPPYLASIQIVFVILPLLWLLETKVVYL